MKKRVTYLDLAKGIGIILVVLGHMENINAGLRTWISSFHMPLFFVISGMLIALKGEDVAAYMGAVANDNSTDAGVGSTGETGGGGKTGGYKSVVIKKARGILVPYLWFSLIYIPIDIMNLAIGHVDMHTFIQNLLDSATFAGISVMWFLPALFIAEVTALFVIVRVRKLIGQNKSAALSLIVTAAAGLIISVLSFYIWSLVRPSYDANAGSYVIGTLLALIRVLLRGTAMSVHVIAGYVSYILITKVDEYIANVLNKSASQSDSDTSIEGMIGNSTQRAEHNNEKRGELRSRVVSAAAGLVLFAVNLLIYAANGDVDNHFMTVSNMPLYYICALIGSLSVILICKGVNSIFPIDFLGKNSLIIMATHLQCYILYAGILTAIAIDAYVTRAKSYVYMFNSVLFTMLFETVIILIINRIFPFITGKGSIKDLKFLITPKRQKSQ